MTRNDPLEAAVNPDVLRELEGHRSRKRKRTWEKKALGPYSFRPPSAAVRAEIADGVRKLSEQYGVSQGDMASWLMLAAIKLTEDGELQPERTFAPSNTPYTLFPE